MGPRFTTDLATCAVWGERELCDWIAENGLNLPLRPNGMEQYVLEVELVSPGWVDVTRVLLPTDGHGLTGTERVRMPITSLPPQRVLFSLN